MDDASLDLMLERKLIAACLADAELVNQAVSLGIDGAKFRDAFHREIFSACHAAAKEGQSGVLAVLDRLSVARCAETFQKIQSIATEFDTRAGFAHLCQSVLGAWRKRVLVRAGTELALLAQKPATWEETWAEAGPLITKAQEVAQNVTTETTAEIVERARLAFHERLTRPDDWGMSWGLLDLDQEFGRIKREFIVIAARPSIGKSTLAGQIGSAMLRPKQGRPHRVAVFNLETPNEEFTDRMVCHEMQFQISRAFGEAQIKKVDAKYHEIRARQGFYMFDQIHDIDRIEAKIRTLAAGPGVDLVIVDYLQIVEAKGIPKNVREQQVAHVSRRLKLLVNAIKCPIIGVAQINREAEKDNRRPRLSDLRESGSLEQDADRVIFLHSEQQASDSLGRPEVVPTIAIQEKCKNGAKGVVVPLELNGPLYTFRCVAR